MANRPQPAATMKKNSFPVPYLMEAICCYEGFTLHAVAWENKLLHLTFAPEAHDRIKRNLQARYPAVSILFSSLLQNEILYRLQQLAAGRQKRFLYPVHPLLLESGTCFQQRVWKLLNQIPHGETRTYGELARELGCPGCARAVGWACRANPLVLIIPCHRVVAKTGPGGFNGGLRIKERLLAMEGICFSG